MKKACLFLAALIGAATCAVHAAPPQQPKASGIESGDYVWHKPSSEETEAQRLRPDRKRGAVAYEVCRGCHRADGSGRDDGSYPQLAKQHRTVLIKQMVDIREGVRDNPKMFPFAGKHIITTQDIADIAAYLEALPLPAHNGRGPGKNLERGSTLYERDCRTCHGVYGEGDNKKFYPMVAGQHYAYMVRQISQIRARQRRNANLDMVKAVQNYSTADIEAVADYMSRLGRDR